MMPREFLDGEDNVWSVHPGAASKDIYMELEKPIGVCYQIWMPAGVVHMLWDIKDETRSCGGWDHVNSVGVIWRWQTNFDGSVVVDLRYTDHGRWVVEKYVVPEDVLEYMFLITPRVDKDGVVIDE